MAEMVPGGAWRIEAGMVENLRKRDAEGAVEKLKIDRVSTMPLRDQTTYRGRTWIDRFTAMNEPLRYHDTGSERRSARAFVDALFSSTNLVLTRPIQDGENILILSNEMT